tara:strand:+ start:469 stop:774 length:306 start_codon:yes stop_codon:yes gene_type:complete
MDLKYLPLIMALFMLSFCSEPRADDKRQLVEFMLSEGYAVTQASAECFVKYVNELEDAEWQTLMWDLKINPHKNFYSNNADENAIYNKVIEGNFKCKTRLN